MSDWPRKRIDEFALVTDYVANGSFASLKTNVEYLDRPDFAVLVRLADYNSRWKGPFVYVSERSYQFLKKSKLEPGDIVISNVGANAGTVFRAPELGRPMTLGPNSITVKPDGNARFYYYYFSSPEGQQQLRSILSGSAQPKFNKTDFRQLVVPCPTRQTQDVIASVLGALDDKIELNRRISETLEAIARAIFKSWFVDFDPVRAKAEGREPAGICHDTARLFPSSLDKDDGTDVPSGWRIGEFMELATMSREAVNPCEFPGEVFDHYSIPAFDEGQKPVSEPGAAIKSNKFHIGTDAVLLSKLNPRIPRIWMPELSKSRRAVCSTEFLVLRPSTVTREYLYGLCSSRGFLQEFVTMVTGTSGSHQRVKPEFLEAMRVVVPDGEVVRCYTTTVAPLHQRTAMNLRESEVLMNLRDTLLPKLLSGEVRVKHAEKVVGAAV